MAFPYGSGFPLQSFCEKQKGFPLQSLTQKNLLHKFSTMTDLLNKCLVEWNCKIEYACNFEASQQRRILEERKEDDITIVLRGSDGKYFIEEYKGKTMYPTVYRVLYQENIVELTEEGYQRWLKEKSK